MATCGFPCNCECLTGLIYEANFTLGGKVYIQGSCATSDDPDNWCCDSVTMVGHNSVMNDGGFFYMAGNGGDPDTKCNCVYTGAFILYEDGDFSKTNMPFTITMYIYDSGIVYAELVGGGKIFSGYGVPGVSCVIKCYDKALDPEHPFDPYIYTPRQGVAYFIPPWIGTTIITVTAKDSFDVTLKLNAPVDSIACKNTCIVSKRVYRGGGGTEIRITANGRDGRCPTVSEALPANFPNLTIGSDCDGESVCPDDWKSPGWHCREFNGMYPDGITHKLDCNGNAKVSLQEWVEHKSTNWPGGGTIPCELDCCDMFVYYDYAGAAFEDQAAWWKPQIGLGWTEDPLPHCLSAASTGFVVWQFEIDCTHYYRAIDPSIPQYLDPPFNLMKNPAWPWPTFILSAPCSVVCKFYDNAYLEDEIPPILLVAYPGERVGGVELNHLLVVKSQKTRLHTDTVTVPPPTVTYTMCTTETYDEICAINISPIAPAISISIYTCPNCAPGCYEDDGVTAKPGFLATRYYSEIIYGVDRASAVAAATARGTDIEASVTGDLVPFAHTLAGVPGIVPEHSVSANGCCRQAYGEQRPYYSMSYIANLTWADSGHASMCNWGLEYLSTKVNPTPSPGKEWQTTLIFCCQCLGENFCCRKIPAVYPEDSSYTDFFGEVVMVDSVADPDGNYCRDFDTAKTAVDGWRTYAQERYADYCWPWFNNTYPAPWQYISDIGGPNDCQYVVSNHYLLYVMGDTYTTYVDPVTHTNFNRKCTKLVCQNRGTDLLPWWRWVGMERICRDCETKCIQDGAHDCASNPCLSAWIASSYSAISGGVEPVPARDHCTANLQNNALAYINRHSHGTLGDYSTWPYIPVCDDTLQVQNAVVLGVNEGRVHAISYCGVHYCATECGFRTTGVNESEMYTRGNCSGVNSYFGPGDPSFAMKMSTCATALSRCYSGVPSKSAGYEFCNIGKKNECCLDTRWSTDAADYNANGTPKVPWPQLFKKPMPGSCFSMMPGFVVCDCFIVDYMCTYGTAWTNDQKKPTCT